jgi:hypothetical protein
MIVKPIFYAECIPILAPIAGICSLRLRWLCGAFLLDADASLRKDRPHPLVQVA